MDAMGYHHISIKPHSDKFIQKIPIIEYIILKENIFFFISLLFITIREFFKEKKKTFN
jgi:hypothetical protein